KLNIRENWCAKGNTDLTDEERGERDRKWNQQRAEREAERQRQQDKAAAKAALILESAQPAADDHPYLINKVVKATPGVLVGQWEQRGRDHCLLIPFKNAAGQITTVQAISADQPLIGDSNKDWLIGGKKSGSFFTLGDPVQAAQIIVCEGYATGASIHEATGDCVIVAGDAGNLKPVAAAISIYKKPILIAGDNDLDNPDNPGLKAAKVAAESVKGTMVAPNFTPDEVTAWRSAHGGKCPSDYNDMSVIRGLDAVKELLAAPSLPAQPTPTPSLLKYDHRGNPSLVAHSVAANLLYESEFHSRLYYDPVVCNWLHYQESGVFKLCPDLMIQQAVYNAIEKYTGDFGFQSAYVSGVSSCLRHKAIKQPKKPSGLICFNNGVLDLSTRQLLPHSPDYFFTNQLPFDWIPHAPDPTLIIDWLREATGGHDDQVELIRAWFHAVIVGRSDLQRFLEVMGFGGSGKGTLLRLVSAVVGNEAIHSTKIEHLENNRFETAKIFNKKLVVVTDAEKWHGDVSVLKSITGQDPIRFEEKNKQSGDSFTFGGMVMILANQHTASNDYSSGIQRRKITVAFDHVVPAEKRRDLDAEFEPLLPNLIRWALDMPESEVTAYLRTTSSRVKSLQAIRLENLEATNPIAAWLRSNCKFDPNATTQIGAKSKITITTGEFSRETRTEFEHSATRLYPNYCQWCEQTGKQPISLNTFSRTVIDASQNMLGKPFVKSARQGGTGKTLISGLTLRPCEDHCEPYLIDCEECEDREELKKVSGNVEDKNFTHSDPASDFPVNLGRSEEVPRVLHVLNNQGVSPHMGLHSASHVKAEREDVKHSTPVTPAPDRLSGKPCSLCRHLIPGKFPTCGRSQRVITAVNSETCSEFAGRGLIQGGVQ
ncbi:MAG: toprim domain-containing protein, partial [Candidatus Competibacteraceae bacterium]|nr:toprim domain-containing protein [Candidatus Competibacteraceae bacterium]